LPSDAQARLLRLVAAFERQDETIEWLTNAEATYWINYRPSFARLLVERVDRERDVARFMPAVETRENEARISTVRACFNRGWLESGERMCVVPATRYDLNLGRNVETKQTFWLRSLDLTEDGRIALGVWGERRLNADPPPLPRLDERQQEIVQLAQRAYELGYALCAREPARDEARRMRKDGWWDGCWVANSATGLVPSPLAVVEVFPERADEVAA
jgi:hypothetical protein